AIASHLVGPQQYGALGTLLTLTVALTIPLAALQTAVTRASAEVDAAADHRRFMRRAVGAASLFGVAVALVSPIVASYAGLSSIVPALLLGPYVALAAIAATTRGVVMGRARFRDAARSIIATTLVRLSVGVALTAQFGAAGALIGTVAAEGAGVVVGLRALR